MTNRELMAKALRYAIEDRRALVSAYRGEGEVADGARREIVAFQNLHKRIGIQPARRMTDLLDEGASFVNVLEIKRLHDAQPNTNLSNATQGERKTP